MSIIVAYYTHVTVDRQNAPLGEITIVLKRGLYINKNRMSKSSKLNAINNVNK